MKVFSVLTAFAATSIFSFHLSAQSNIKDSVGKETHSLQNPANKHLFIDVHHLGAGNVNYDAVAGAHAKDLQVEKKYGVHFIKFWVDEAAGNVYCLASSADSISIRKSHAEAHGLLPDQIYPVTDGPESLLNNGKDFYLDIHELGAGKVTAKDVAGAHQKDLATQGKYGVNFINYWVNEKEGRVVCLSQASDSSAVIKTHKEAHGLVPTSIVKVKQGE